MECECEHVDHFDNGPAHVYLADASVLAVLKTNWGTYKVCIKCQHEHFKMVNVCTNPKVDI